MSEPQISMDFAKRPTYISGLNRRSKRLSLEDKERDKPKHWISLLDLKDRAHLQPLVNRVMEGMNNGESPELCEEGAGGTYFLSDSNGEKIAVFKPQDEEPFNLNNPKGYRPRSGSSASFKEGILIGEASVRECAAYLLDHENFSGVPPTDLVICEHPAFHLTTEPLDGEITEVNAKNEGKKKVGSLQKFKRNDGNTEDISLKLISQFPIDEVHKIALLDIRLFNTDRHGGNILFKKKEDSLGGFQYVLIPIDHGYTLPSTLDEAWFAWQYWPQVKAKMSDRTRQYIRHLDAEKDIAILRENFPKTIREEHFRILRISTMLLKKAEAADLTLFDIANIMCRSDIQNPSVLEELCSEAEKRTEGSEDRSLFLDHLALLIDQEIERIKCRRN